MPSDQGSAAAENSLINLEENPAQTRPTGATINNSSIETMTGYELKASLVANYMTANLEWTITSATLSKHLSPTTVLLRRDLPGLKC